MGLDVYVGPLTRYTLGDWLTIVQQAGRASGHDVQIVRTTPVPADAITDLAVVTDAVESWQRGLLAALGAGEPWPDQAGLPYSTDKPDWDGYGGLVLLAAYDERLDLRPGQRTGLLGRKLTPDAARSFAESKAYQSAAKAPVKYPTLLSGVEWWLPLSEGPTVFTAPRLTGQPTKMGRVDQLVAEVQELAGRMGLTAKRDLDAIRRDGPPPRDTDVVLDGKFGIAVFLKLACEAARLRAPLLLDY